MSILFPNSQKNSTYYKVMPFFPHYAEINEMNIKVFMNVKQ